MPNVYDSVVDSFGVDFLSDCNGYYPKGGRKVLFEECLIYGKRVSSETMKIADISICMKNTIRVGEMNCVKNFVKQRFVKLENIVVTL